MARSALLVGATGLVGGNVLTRLLADARWERVVVLVRRALGRADAKLTERVVDFESLDGTDVGAIDDVFCCLGTTIKIAGSEERFRRVDHDYTVAAARLARAAGATRIALVSSVGASAKSKTFYYRVKGETEDAVRALEFGSTVIARPSFLRGERSETRLGERAGILVTRALSPLLVGSLREYRPIAAGVVAAAMIDAIADGAPGALVLDHGALIVRGGAGS